LTHALKKDKYSLYVINEGSMTVSFEDFYIPRSVER
jgi:hypothetical protein